MRSDPSCSPPTAGVAGSNPAICRSGALILIQPVLRLLGLLLLRLPGGLLPRQSLLLGQISGLAEHVAPAGQLEGGVSQPSHGDDEDEEADKVEGRAVV
mmetsp:Transcript_8167/g.22733  ORF Transcript_8167/g.22733 Transcript_8167/m.22733 type:complete len:99 (+) Transcript_8167:590-886(+)